MSEATKTLPPAATPLSPHQGDLYVNRYFSLLVSLTCSSVLKGKIGSLCAPLQYWLAFLVIQGGSWTQRP